MTYSNAVVIVCHPRCRFGAEELFKTSEAEAEAKAKQLYEEDIDAILGRAEIVDNAQVGRIALGAGAGRGPPAVMTWLSSLHWAVGPGALTTVIVKVKVAFAQDAAPDCASAVRTCGSLIT